ncbi:unnamed protein product [Brassicogethes aeneus]|uniref:Serine/threonine-protein kinase 11-interacting protein n=1 Tax=Brassicogethes aeneus TaxID=1431903 RepID=A0A9P0BJ07_BRAAE|nr:unnamed protein product [Brassicogethes aeneus]
MDSPDLSQIINILRPTCKSISSGKETLCVSVNYLHRFNNLINENSLGGDMSSSFQVLSNIKVTQQRDIQFLEDFLQTAVNLKIVPDIEKYEGSIDIRKFSGLKNLECQKINTNFLIGLQKLRSQLKQITFTHCHCSIADILDKCAGDNTSKFTWNELKLANFSNNRIKELDVNFDTTPCLQTLDLSHNELTNFNCFNILPNLKHLNLSYNKLVNVPQFRGPICNRLQSLIISHNFLEDILNLASIVNVIQIDLSQNCIIDHKSLLAVSHLISLQTLNLLGNPLTFHPHHRNLSCNYLNKNTATTKFVLDNILLSKSEKTLVGSFYPIKQTSLTSSHNSSEEMNITSVSERGRRVRNVEIKEEGIKEEKTIAASPSVTSSQHLEIKKQVEHLRKEFGESWLNNQSGLLVKDVLGLEHKMALLSSTPYETALENTDVMENISEIKSENLNFETANDQSFENTIKQEETKEPESDISDGEDVYMGGEESMYLAKIQDSDEVFVVVTETHISERNSITSKETARWHNNTVLTCEFLEDSLTAIKITFNTIRRDRKQRIYELEEDEARNLVNAVKDKIINQEPRESKVLKYQCIKCSETFTKNKVVRVVEEPIECPKCEGKIVVQIN